MALTVGTAGARFGVYEDPASGRTQHPVALENNQSYVPNIGTADGLYRYMAAGIDIGADETG